ncbi:hypothetical protein BGZ74_008833 [Mortierella antarctica]|nr:hypothetical protein BGZ74_008833 [Mortierella antarctica]
MTSNPSQTGGRNQGTAMTSQDASRIQSAADRNPSGHTSTSGFKERAQSAAAHNTQSSGARNESAGGRKKSSSSTTVEAAPKAEETQHTTASMSTSSETPTSTTPETLSTPTPTAPTVDDTQNEPTVSTFTSLPSTPADAMQFDEYKDPEDIYERFKVSDAMNELAACSSLGSNIRNYYRYGTFKDCAVRYDHLKFCLSIKTKSSQVAQVMIQKRDAELAAKKAAAPNSEDVWTLRSHPPAEFVELSRQG